MRIKHNAGKWGWTALVWLLLPWVVLVLGGCGGGEEIDSATTESSVTSSSAQPVGQQGAIATAGDDTSRAGDRFFQAAVAAKKNNISPEVLQEFDRLSNRIEESQKTDPRSRPSEQAVTDLENFLRRIDVPATEPAKATN